MFPADECRRCTDRGRDAGPSLREAGQAAQGPVASVAEPAEASEQRTTILLWVALKTDKRPFLVFYLSYFWLLLSGNGVRSFTVFEEFVVHGLSQLLPQEGKTGGEGDVGRANCFRARLKRKGLRFTR